MTLLPRIIAISFSLFCCACFSGGLAAGDLPVVRVGVLKFGTVNWELDIIRKHQLAEQQGIDLEVVPLGSKNATAVAIQGGAVDVVVTDWIWVSRQRAEGQDYTFFPYSNAVGALMVDPEAGIAGLEDLAGKNIGVAGGPVDKSWLLLRAYGQQVMGEDLAEIAEPSFGAPPLLNELALRGDLPAVLNFWHYGARLEAAGMQPLIRVPDLLQTLGVERPVPLLGWIFHQDWAEKNPAAIKGFLAASYAAKKILLESDSEWEWLAPKLKTEDGATKTALRDTFRKGIPNCFGAAEIEAAGATFAILARQGGSKLVGKSKELQPGTFWNGFDIGACTQ